jgi:putative uncharacterized protein orf8
MSSQNLHGTVLVLSDVHASSRDDAKYNSKVALNNSLAFGPRDPLTDLQRAAKHILDWQSVDLLLAPGDFVDRGDAPSIPRVWETFQTIGEILDVPVIGTLGNHDVVVKSPSLSDSIKPARERLSNFPTSDQLLNEHYWERNWCISEQPKFRILVVNTVASAKPEKSLQTHELNKMKLALEQGHISCSMIREIDHAINQIQPDNKIPILLLHHHARDVISEKRFESEYGPTQNVSQLIHMLDNHVACTGQWMIVHGHKHLPAVYRLSDTTDNGPFALAAASVGARAWPDIIDAFANQAHTIEFASRPDTTHPLYGVVRSWSWLPGYGWLAPTGPCQGLAKQVGFGYQVSPRRLATEIETIVNKESYLDISELPENLPYYKYVFQKTIDDAFAIICRDGYALIEDSAGEYRWIRERR